MNDFIFIEYLNKKYKIDINKFSYVASILEGKTCNIKTQKEIEEILVKYSLYDKTFFENINKI